SASSRTGGAYGADLTMHVITVPETCTVPTQACWITREVIPLHLLPCPQIDCCEEPLPITRVPEERLNHCNSLRTGNIPTGAEHHVVAQCMLCNPSLLPWPSPVGSVINKESTSLFSTFPQFNHPDEVSVGWIDETNLLGISSHVPQRGPIIGQSCSHLGTDDLSENDACVNIETIESICACIRVPQSMSVPRQAT